MTTMPHHLDLYRLPWSLADNGISWLEPTTKCNIRCPGCYRVDTGVHKSLSEVREELEVFAKLRNSDCISVAGGEPLIHPNILDIVSLIRDMGWKPIVNSNGVALTKELLAELKAAGVYGFTFHVDSGQQRGDTSAKTEEELNEVRYRLASMVAEAGNIACSFNATISESNIDEVPALAKWAIAHPSLVQTMVFILFRSPEMNDIEDFDCYANGKLLTESPYQHPDWAKSRKIVSADVVEAIRSVDPEYAPAGYLNGTMNPDSFKWLLANRFELGGKTIGYGSPRFLELAQTSNHLLTGRYLAYGKPLLQALGKLNSFITGFVDWHMMKIFLRSMWECLKNPLNIFRSSYVQNFMIIQPVDIDEMGRQDMCDSCPDVTVHNGRLVWSCRLEELNTHGAFVNIVPKDPSDHNNENKPA